MGTLSSIGKGLLVIIMLLIIAYIFGGPEVKHVVAFLFVLLYAVGLTIFYGILFIIAVYIIYRVVRAGGPYVIKALSI